MLVLVLMEPLECPLVTRREARKLIDVVDLDGLVKELPSWKPKVLSFEVRNKLVFLLTIRTAGHLYPGSLDLQSVQNGSHSHARSLAYLV